MLFQGRIVAYRKLRFFKTGIVAVEYSMLKTVSK